MSDLTLIQASLRNGVWEGILTSNAGGTLQPSLNITYLGKDVPDASISDDDTPGKWVVRVPIPPEAVAEGVQTFLITDKSTGETLSSFALYAGDALDEDIRAEVALLRDELDMLKRAFRRHCVETT